MELIKKKNQTAENLWILVFLGTESSEDHTWMLGLVDTCPHFASDCSKYLVHNGMVIAVTAVYLHT